MEIKDNTFLRQFEISVDKQLLSLEYSLQERKIFLTKLNVPEGISFEKTSEFVKKILDQLGEKKNKSSTYCTKGSFFLQKESSLQRNATSRNCNLIMIKFFGY